MRQGRSLSRREKWDACAGLHVGGRVMGSLALEPGLALWRVGSTKRRAGGSLPGLQPPFYRGEQVGDPCRGRGRTVSASLPPGGGEEKGHKEGWGPS